MFFVFWKKKFQRKDLEVMGPIILTLDGEETSDI
jgi:hypothetical protein